METRSLITRGKVTEVAPGGRQGQDVHQGFRHVGFEMSMDCQLQGQVCSEVNQLGVWGRVGWQMCSADVSLRLAFNA